MMIGVIDSGTCGLHVLKLLHKAYPGQVFTYLGDTAFFPFGGKSRVFAANRLAKLIERQVDFGVRTIVLTCPVMASVSAAVLKDACEIRIVDPYAMIPFEAVKNAKAISYGVMTEESVIESDRYMSVYNEAFGKEMACSVTVPLLRDFVEQDWIKRPEGMRVIKKHLHPFKMKQVNAIFLNSPHLSFIQKLISEKAGKRLLLVDPFSNVSQWLTETAAVEEADGVSKTPKVFLTDVTEGIKKRAKRFYGSNIAIEVITI